MRRLFLGTWLVVLFFCISGFAAGGSSSNSGVMLRPGGMYWTHYQTDGGNPENKTTITHTDLDLKLGFKMDSGMFIGGTYFYSQNKLRTESTSTVETTDDITAYGPTLGYVGDGFYILGTYHIAPTWVTGNDTSKTTYLGGSGYQIDLGYMFWVSSNIGIGPQFTYYNATYTKSKTSSGTETTLPNNAANTDLRPILAFAFVF